MNVGFISSFDNLNNVFDGDISLWKKKIKKSLSKSELLKIMYQIILKLTKVMFTVNLKTIVTENIESMSCE